MKTIKTILALSGLAASVTLALTLSQPVDTGAYGLIGHNLGTAQRDFRVFNNFTDTQANNNTAAHANFPGALGAVQAIWKAHVEWGSDVYAGNGQGDSTQAVLGDSGANFDNKFEGEATSTGGTSSNIHSELNGSNGGVLAFMQGGGSGWWIRYYSGWTWQDGPGTVSSGIDLQGVACHESGHAHGLDHSNVSGATMLPSISGTGQGQRSINNDDRAGLQAIYGVKSASKPHVTGLSGSTNIGQTLTIIGSNFATGSNNDVWFTKANSNGVPVKVTNVSAAGGTTINVTIPSGIQDGDIIVQNKNLSSHSSLSNAWPFDVGNAGNPPLISSVTPPAGPEGGWTQVVIAGGNFLGTTSVRFGGNEAHSFTIDSSTQITAVTPSGTLFSAVDVEIQSSEGTGILSSGYIYTFNPGIGVNTVTPNSGPDTGGTSVTLTGGSAVGITGVNFDGVPATSVTVTSASSVTCVTPPGTAGLVDVVVDLGPTLTGAYTYVSSGPGGSFVNIGPGVAGTGGTPLLTGTGDLTPGSGTGYSTTISNAIPSNAGFLFLSLTEGPVPFKGGNLYPFPILGQFVLPMSGAGSLTIPHTIPAGQGYEGLNIILQWWFADGAAIKGASASNGLRLEIP